MANSTMKRFCATALLGLMLSTTAVPVSAQTLDEFAARGEVLAAADPLAAELRSRLDEAGQRGFDIGMGGTEGESGMGPGKQRRGESLPAEQQAGYFAAVLFSVTRNANQPAAHLGARIAQGVPALAAARRGEDDPFYALGFDIATGLLAQSQGALGDLAQTMGASSVRGTLSGATQRGFDASAQMQGRSYAGGSTATSTPPGDFAVSDSTTDGTAGVDQVGSVPNVVGLTQSAAWTALGYAGYSNRSVVEVDVRATTLPVDQVIDTRPAAGTTLPKGSAVVIRVPRAWLVQGEGALTTNDQDTRLGFDFDTGKYARIGEGADIYTTSQPFYVASPYETYRNQIKTSIHLAPDVKAVRPTPPNFPEDAGTFGTARGTAEDCESRFSNYPASTTLTANPQRGANSSGEWCIATNGGRIARVSISGSGVATVVGVYGDNANYSFRYVTFLGRPKAQGRVVVPGAPPSALSQLSICEKAKWARDRGSPAAPGLTKQCLASGGTVPQ